MTLKLRVGVIPYLNVRPLIWDLEKEHTLVTVLPSSSPDALGKGHVDVAIAPVAAHLAHPQWPVVSAAVISSKGPVKSVRLLHKGPLEEVRRLWADTDSLTSVLLSRLLLKRWCRVKDLEVHPSKTGAFHPGEILAGEAVLQIGDKALAPVPEGFLLTDLGDKWFRHTGLPFVFAIWTAKDATTAREAAPALWTAKEAGLRHLDEIAEKYDRLPHLPVAERRKYLRENLRFEYGEDEKKAIALFARYLREEGLLPW